MSHEDPQYEAPGPDPLVGKVVQDRYKIERRLGQGGMGAVYLAEHVLIQKKVAIKCLHAGLASNPDVVRRFHNEAVSATAIGHPHIVDVTDMGKFDDGTFFMVLEYLAGRDWQSDIDTQPVQPVAKVAHVGAQICDALEAACAKGIVHRDLKPENIFLIERHGDPDFVKILDFGISKFRSGVGGSTRTGELMGTPYYMAPEQVRGDPDLNHLADVYSLGVIFFQALSGDVPFDGQTLPELILKIVTSEAPRLDLLNPNIPKPISDLIGRMLSKDASGRPQSFREVGEILHAYDTSTGRMSTSAREFNMQTAALGSAKELSRGEPVPSKGPNPTPYPSRGPDTNAGGTPGAFGATALHLADESGAEALPAKDPVAKASAAIGDGTAAPHLLDGRHSGASAATERPPASRKAAWPAISLGVLAVAAGTWFALGARGAPEPPSAALEALPAEDKVRVQISTVPPDADLELDGKPITNPFDGKLKRDDQPHTLVAKRHGFDERSQRFTLADDQQIFVQLTQAGTPEPKADVVAPSPSPQPAAPSRQVPKSPKPSPSPVAAPAPAPPPPAPVAAPAPAPAPKANDGLKNPFG